MRIQRELEEARLFVAATRAPDDVEDEAWLADEDVPALCRAKVRALKLCRNRSISQASSSVALEILSPAIKLYVTLLRNEGSFSPDSKEP